MSLARALADLAVKVMPAERRPWAKAARAELDHVPANAALSFAAGGLITAMRFRLIAPALVLGLVRYGLATGALLWAVNSARLAFHLRHSPDPLPMAVLISSTAIYGIGALVTAFAGLRVTKLLILPLLALVGMYALAGGLILPQAPNSAFYRALAAEDAGVLITALLLAGWALRRSERLP